MKYLTEIINEAKSIDLKKSMDKKRKDKAIYTKTFFLNSNFKNGVLELEFESQNKIQGSGKKHKQKIKFENLKFEKLDKKTLLEIFKNNDIKVHCDCEDFLYGGYKYIGTIKQYSIEPENREPKKKNPNLTGSVCKHLFSVINKLHVFVDKILENIEK